MDDNKKIEELEARIAVLEDKLDFLYGIGRSEKLGAYLKKMKRISAAAQFLAESLDRPEIAKQVEEIQREELRKNFDVDDAQEAQEYVDEANKLYNEENKKLNDIIENLKNNDMNAVAGHDPSVSGVGSEEVSQLVKNSDIMYGYKRSSETVGLLKDENSLFDFSDSNDAWMEAYSNLDDDDYDEYDNYDLTNNTAESMPAPVAQPETKPEPVQESEPESPYITTNKPKKKKSPKVAETDANLFEFLETDGGLKLIVYKGTDEKNIVIPASVGGTDVVEIGDSLFNKINSIETVVLPDTIKRISDNAFNTPSLKKIQIPDSVEEISDNAFYHYHSDYNVTVYCNDGSEAIKYANKKGISKDDFDKFNEG